MATERDSSGKVKVWTLRLWQGLAVGLALYVGLPAFGGDRSATEADSGEDRAGETAVLRHRFHATSQGEAGLISALDRAPSERELRRLLTRLGRVGGDRSVPRLAELAHDPRWPVAKAAIIALGDIGNDAAVSVLVELSEVGPTWQVGQAIAALAASNHRAAVDRLMEIALDPGHAHRLDGIGGIGKTSGHSVEAFLHQLTWEGNIDVTKAAIDAAAELGTEAANQFIHTLAASSDRRIRVAALRVVSSTDDPAALASLLDTVKGADPAAAAAAAAALGEAREPTAVPALLDLARGGGLAAREEAMRALVTIGTPEAMAELAALAGSPGPLGASAARALAWRGDEASADALAQAIRNRPNGRTDYYLLRELQGLHGDAASELFLDIARNGSGDARGVAISHLASVRHPEFVELAAVTAASGGKGAQEAIWALGATDDPAARRALLDIAGRGDSASDQALQALAERNGDDPEVFGLLSERLLSGRTEQATTAAQLLAASGSAEGREVLLEAIAGGDPDRAAAAAFALKEAGNARDPEVRSAFVELAERGGNAEARATALTGLVIEGDDRGIDLARTAVIGADEELASAVIGKLSREGGPAAYGLLQEAVLSSAAPETRTEALQALALAGDPSMLDFFAEMAGDGDADVRAQAFSGLVQIDSPASIERLVSQSHEVDPEVQKQILGQLSWSEQPAAHDELARIIRDGTPELAAHTIGELYRSSNVIDGALRAALASPHREVALAAAKRLQEQGVKLDAQAQARIAELLAMQS